MPTPRAASIIASLTPTELLGFITKQRWFAGKSGAPSGARVASSTVLPWGDGRFAIARVVVTAESGDVTYQLPLAASDPIPGEIADQFVVRRAGDGRPALYDAVHDPAFRAGLIRALAEGAVAENNGSRWTVESFANDWPPDASSITSIVGSAEQSNTSIVIGDRAILKLFRILKSGLHPDVEVTQFLARAGFANTPRLLATIQFDDAGEVTTAGMVQTLLPGASDAWTYTLERARPYFAAPTGRDAPNAFVKDITRLGAVTRAMHEALAGDDDDPAFSPEPIAPEDLERWAQRTQHSIRESLSLLERQLSSPEFPQNRVAEAQALVRRRDHYVGWIDEIVDNVGESVGDGARIRIHGDYHLGQVLRTSTGDFMVIDFEGEPAKPLEERREKTSPLRDVAGMLRSIAYAAATLATSVEKTVDMPTRELRAARWERDAREAFLAGYLAATTERDDAPELFPEAETQIRQLLALFETEKAFYELTYELNNRPTWAWIPMRGIAKLFVTR